MSSLETTNKELKEEESKLKEQLSRVERELSMLRSEVSKTESQTNNIYLNLSKLYTDWVGRKTHSEDTDRIVALSFSSTLPLSNSLSPFFPYLLSLSVCVPLVWCHFI